MSKMYVYNYTLCSIGKIFIVYTKLSILFAMYNNLYLFFCSKTTPRSGRTYPLAYRQRAAPRLGHPEA